MPKGVYPRPNISNRVCYCCGSNETLSYGINHNHMRWYLNNDKDNTVLCHHCYNKLFDRPKWSRTRLWFKSQRILLKENPRTGICSHCGGIKGIDCKQTHIHHIEYHLEDPLKDTIELCPRCHAFERQIKT